MQTAVPDCSGCEACAAACPSGAIKMRPQLSSFRYPLIDTSTCIGCRLCLKVCPILNATPPPASPAETLPATYAAWHKDTAIRLKSSSGGIFSALADHVLAQGGIIYGATMGADLAVRHVRVVSSQELAQLRASKYVQSSIGNAYALARADLVAGFCVLFVGVACQIGGLKAFLRKDYPNLITADVLCHGVPSELFFDKYIAWLEQSYKQKVTTVEFRNKDHGWKEYFPTVVFENGVRRTNNLHKDEFFKGFLSDICLRKGCCNCAYKCAPRISDITLGDFWGIDQLHPQWDDDQGTSVIFVHTPQGAEIYAAIAPQIESHPVPYNDAILCNTAYYKSPALHPRYAEFERDLPRMSFKRLMIKYFHTPHPPLLIRLRILLGKIKRKLKRLL